MLRTPAPFPQAGCHALFVDDLAPTERQRAELVRVVMHVVPEETDAPKTVLIAFPLRPGATGQRTVDLDALIDGTPLSKAEERELADLDRFLTGKPATSRYAAKYQRLMALKDRLTMGALLRQELDRLARTNAREAQRAGGSHGAILPRDACAEPGRGVA